MPSRTRRHSPGRRAGRAGSGFAGPVIDPTNILTRRVKQGIAEWYALDMIKRTRDGFGPTPT